MSMAAPATSDAAAATTLRKTPTTTTSKGSRPPQSSSNQESCCFHHSQSRSSHSLSSRSKLASISSSRPSLRSRASARAAIEATLCLRIEDLCVDSSSTPSSTSTSRHSSSSSGSISATDSSRSYQSTTLTPPSSRPTSPIARGPCSMSYPNYIDAKAVSGWILKGNEKERKSDEKTSETLPSDENEGNTDDNSSDFQVVDVRDGDYVGGHIKGSAHFPSQEFDPAAIYRRFGDKSKIIFHCAMSQQRGPKAAILYARYLQEQQNEQDEKDGNLDDPESTLDPKSKQPSTLQTVYILRNGFHGWGQKYGQDSRLTEDFAEDIWQI